MAGNPPSDNGSGVFEDSMEILDDSGLQNTGDDSGMDQSGQDDSIITDPAIQADIDAYLAAVENPEDVDRQLARNGALERAAEREKAAAAARAHQDRAVQAGIAAQSAPTQTAGAARTGAAQTGGAHTRGAHTGAAQSATAGGTQAPPVIGAVPGSRPQPPTGSIAGTRFACEYKSTLTCEAAIHDPQLLPLLAHVNCSYLSTYANPPTLTELKQHVQSLIVLIKALTVTTSSAFIDNANLGPEMEDAMAFHDGETYDFLNDLNNHYNGPETSQLQVHHSMPLNSALNTVEVAQVIPTQTACACAASKQAPLPLTGKAKQHPRGQSSSSAGPTEALEVVRNICPMLHAWAPAPNQESLPYATHQSLISHANEILELLDHEYSAKGGLLSILPPKEQEKERKNAETTILGQLILHMQRLVIRCHDLERLYANATDAMASEALIPAQTLSRLGPDGRKGRELVYPQDRFVLVNCGEDVYSFLSNAFDRKDIQDEEIMKKHLKSGSTGEALWRQRDGREYSRGITALDVVTRYYRIRGDEKAGCANKTIFIIPAHAEHPGVKVTREIEAQPTVVAVVKPQWPERQSILEIKTRQDVKDLKVVKDEKQQLLAREENLTHTLEFLRHKLQCKEGTIFSLKEKLDAQDIALNRPEGVASAELLARFYTNAIKAKTEAEAAVAKVEADKAAAKAAKDEADQILAHTIAQQKQWDKQLAALRAQEKAEREKRVQKLRAADEESARVALALQEKVQGYWHGQIQQTQVLIEHLKARGCDPGNDVPNPNTVATGMQNGTNAFNSLVGGGGHTWLQPGHSNDPDHDQTNESTSGFMREASDESMDDYGCCDH
ncbi:hypothetical protein L207DRAFT_569579 [Hyaloscypha variabilis F]|uniref:Uncharacterized protein n=1 Tax=Hyaloscypha variabilis (strain UAMH 11265 / GT02V1 / F) TaxID=1149755 RepID=A0A2J6RCI6_HYAVF|nr:hypothetical protein L207DRAFT_569579 [Hyaloscypha variabilis F]